MPLLEIAGNGSASVTVIAPGPPPPPPPPECFGVDVDIDNQADLDAAAGLSCVDRLSIFPADSTVVISLPALRSARFILFASKVESFSAPALKRVGVLVARNTRLKVVDISGVEEAGLELADNNDLEALDLGRLKRITTRVWAIVGHGKLASLILPCGVEVSAGTVVDISHNAKLSNGAMRSKVECWGVPPDRYNVTGNGLP